MIKVLQLIFAPFNTWMRIAEAQRSLWFVLVLFLLPLLVMCVGLESYSMYQWGEQRAGFDLMRKVSEGTALRYAAAQIGLLLVCAFFGGYFLHAVAGSFNLATTYTQSFTTVAYGISPLALLRLLDAVPGIPTWICWAIGAVLSIAVLYHGVALMLRPEQTKGFGLYLVTALIVLLSTGLSHFMALAVLHGK